MFPPEPWNMLMFVFASVVNRHRIDAGGTPRQATEAPEDKFVVHVTVDSFFSMVGMDPSVSAKTV